MATALPTNILECSICFDIFKSPKFLPCGHTFCLKCIEQYIGDKIVTFPCPYCQQDVTIPVGGAKMYPTNFQVQPPDTTQSAKQYCSNHKHREIEYYCLKCKTLVCSKCYMTQHHGHEFIDIESETANEEATELVINSEKFIKDKIENWKKTHAALLETSEKLKRFGEDACRRISQQTESIITDLREKTETVQTEIRQNMDQTELQLTETREKVMEQIQNLETNLPCLTEDSDCVQILVSLPKIKELEQLCETMKVDTSEVYQYKEWRENKFSVDINMLGSVVTKSYNLYNHFRFNINDIEKVMTPYYSEDKFTSNDVVWSCLVVKYNDGYLGIYIQPLPSDNPKLDNCIIDCKVSLLNMDDGSKTITKTIDNDKVSSLGLGWNQFISWATFIDKNEGFISSDGQYVVQFDIKQIREIKYNKVNLSRAGYRLPN